MSQLAEFARRGRGNFLIPAGDGQVDEEHYGSDYVEDDFSQGDEEHYGGDDEDDDFSGGLQDFFDDFWHFIAVRVWWVVGEGVVVPQHR